MRLVLLGSSGRQSLVTLQSLIRLDIKPLAVAASGLQIPTTPSLGGIAVQTDDPHGNLAGLVHRHGIRLLDMAAQDVLAELAELAPDVILVSCYPQRLSSQLLSLPRCGCFNIHPSLLPRYRGPSPIFWQLRDGVARLGVSVHKMTQRLDRGPLLCRQQLAPQPPQPYSSWVDALSAAGVRTFASMLAPLQRDSARLAAQSPGGSYQSWPRPADFEVDINWPASRSAAFVAGTAELGQHFIRLHRGELFAIERLLEYTPGRQVGEPLSVAKNRLVLNCADGRLELAGNRVADSAGSEGDNE